MRRFVRVLTLCATIMVGTAAASDFIPNPFWPPDPYERADSDNSIPNPFWPPDPYED
ncbi:MAG: hypothetical protein HY235_07275 [Acidobacteria bacterium]|nr:hypothetical protein [Acidobacteriota bacterium]